MTLGLGIFLSSLFLGIIYLFVSTKDRWNWKKILFVWPLCIVLVVGVIGGAGFYIYNQYENKPTAYDRYIDIPLNASESDLFFLKGDEYLRKDYTKDESFVFYQYEIKDKYQFNVRLKDNKIWRISCYSDTSYDCPSLNKIQIYDSANKVKERLGEPNHVSSNDDNTQRVWVYEAFNIYMILSKGKVNGIGIFEPSLGIPSENDIQTDFNDYNKFAFKDKNLTIIGVPTEIFDPNGDNDKKAKFNLFLEIINTSSDGDKIVWNEYVALKEKEAEERRARSERTAALKKIAKQQAKAEAKSKADELKKLATKEKAEIPEGFVLVKPEASTKIKWSQLKKGMAKYQVEKLLGAPIRKEGRYWYYSEDRRDGAHITFIYNSNAGVQEVSSFKAP